MNLKEYFYESAEVHKDFIDKNNENLERVISIVLECFKKWNKILIAWNGWSAADAQHWAAEFIWRYKLERKSLPAIALTTDTSILTAIWNDYWYDFVFSKQIEWLWNPWDVFFAISTSWNSKNLILAIEKAKEKWIITIGLTWKWWGDMNKFLDINLIVNSNNTPRIQETHLCIYHTICEKVEKILFLEN